MQHSDLATYVENRWNIWNVDLQHTRIATATYAISRWTTPIQKQLKHLEDTFATYVYSHCIIYATSSWNTCNTRMKHTHKTHMPARSSMPTITWEQQMAHRCRPYAPLTNSHSLSGPRARARKPQARDAEGRKPSPPGYRIPTLATRNIHFYDENLNDKFETVIKNRFLWRKFWFRHRSSVTNLQPPYLWWNRVS
jgi:hypothetical protein